MQKDHQSTSGSTLVTDVQLPAVPLSSQPVIANDDSGIKPQKVPEDELKKDQELRLKFAEETHQYVREQIRLADQKATFFFTGATAFLAYLHTQGTTNIWIIKPTAWDTVHMLAFLTTLGLVLCTVACLKTIIPRLDGSKEGLIFFAAINEYENAGKYTEKIMKQSSLNLCEAKLMHTYELSNICRKKYDSLKWGQWSGALAILASLLLFIIR